METIIKVGLKANASFLLDKTNFNRLTAYIGGLYYTFIIEFNEKQFENFEKIIKVLGYDVEKSLTKDGTNGVDYGCYLVE